MRTGFNASKAVLILACGMLPAAGIASASDRPSLPTASLRQLDRPVGTRLHPAQIFLDVAWARAKATPAEKQGLISEAFVAAQLAQRSLAGASITNMTTRLSEDNSEFAAALRARQDTYERSEVIRNGLAEASGRAESEQLAKSLQQLQAALESLEAQDRELARSYPKFARVIQERPISIDELRIRLLPKEALVYVANGDKAVYVFVLNSEKADWYQVRRTAAEIETDVSVLRGQLQPDQTASSEPASHPIGASPRSSKRSFSAEDEGVLPYDHEKAFNLYRALFEPANSLLQNKTAITVIPNRSLSRFPPAALVTGIPGLASAKSGTGRERIDWLIDRFALTTAPSPAALYHLRGLPKPRTRARMFRGVGDPVLDERGNGTPSLASRGTLANVTSQSVLRAASLGGDLTELFGDIPHTAIELEALRRLLKAPPESVSVGYAATESALKHSNFTGVDVIALATHGVLGGEIPWVTEPALIFTPPKTNSNLDDGVLKASEAAVLQLSAELVILSACNTAGPSEREGPGVEGLSGLARAFFYAGARSLLASHWPVYDEVAERLTVLTVQELDTANESAKAVALQRAIIAVRDDKHKDWSHPSVWAPLVLVGDSR